MTNVLVRGSLAKDRVSRDVVKVKVGVGRRRFRSSTPGPISLERVAGGRASEVRILGDMLRRVVSLCSQVRGERASVVAGVRRCCLGTRCHGRNCRPCYSTGKRFATGLVHIRPSKRLVLGSGGNSLEGCTFGRIGCLL